MTAPIEGTVLRVLLRPGESFSTLTPRPLFRMADTSARRVRAEIDERDVLNVRVGQPVVVFPDGHETQRFTWQSPSSSPVPWAARRPSAETPPKRWIMTC